jgi:outer membrane biosynthesis protein TonB
MTDGIELYASTMGPAGKRVRKRLKPGDRLADGTIYTGDFQVQNLKARQETLEAQIDALQSELAAIEQQLAELEEPEEVEPGTEQPPEPEAEPEPESEKPIPEPEPEAEPEPEPEPKKKPATKKKAAGDSK